MQILKPTQTTRIFGAPADWSENELGECLALPIVDVIIDENPQNLAMVSFWKPTPEELALLNSNGHLELWIYGNQEQAHPVVALTVNEVIKNGI